jgi:uncharacterized protein YydD (DUF2326 family)
VKLRALYSNRDDRFSPISFRDGLNVVFAQVRDPAVLERDSHNLGKTFLIDVIDFALLGDLEKEHPFRVHVDLFGEFVFFIEVRTHAGKYVTVRREVKPRQRISMNVSADSGGRLCDVPTANWSFPSLTLQGAREALDDLLDLRVIAPYPYRKGLGYALRRQSDYRDEFQISKFMHGSHKEWKPFVAQLLGFDPDPIMRKYEVEEKIEELSGFLRTLERQAQSHSGEYGAIQGLIQIREEELARLRGELDTFTFREMEADVNEAMVSGIEAQLAELNEKRYVLDYEAQEIDQSLRSDFEFDLDRVRQLFAEAESELPELLMRRYEDLVEFNRRLSTGRRERLTALRDSLTAQRSQIEQQIAALDGQRQRAMAALLERETLEKYKLLHALLREREEAVVVLKQQLAHLDHAAHVEQEIGTLGRERAVLVEMVRQMSRVGSETFSSIRSKFSACVERVLNVQALLAATPNQDGNLEFKTRTLDRLLPGRETSESLGTSYKKLLCVCFDLSVLSTYSAKPYYHFVYHDGVLEGLDNRKKVSLLKLVRDLCAQDGIQYILTVIDSDLPRNETDNKLLFDHDEIVCPLSDEGEQGRLFKMRQF